MMWKKELLLRANATDDEIKALIKYAVKEKPNRKYEPDRSRNVREA